MLVLSRKPGERIRIGGGVIVTVVLVRGNTVRLGFEAPRRIPITREELDPGGRLRGPGPGTRRRRG